MHLLMMPEALQIKLKQAQIYTVEAVHSHVGLISWTGTISSLFGDERVVKF